MIRKRSFGICLGAFLILQSAAPLWAGDEATDEPQKEESAAEEEKAPSAEEGSQEDTAAEEDSAADKWWAKFRNQRRFDSGDPRWAGYRPRGSFGRLRSWNRRNW